MRSSTAVPIDSENGVSLVVAFGDHQALRVDTMLLIDYDNEHAARCDAGDFALAGGATSTFRFRRAKFHAVVTVEAVLCLAIVTDRALDAVKAACDTALILGSARLQFASGYEYRSDAMQWSAVEVDTYRASETARPHNRDELVALLGLPAKSGSRTPARLGEFALWDCNGILPAMTAFADRMLEALSSLDELSAYPAGIVGDARPLFCCTAIETSDGRWILAEVCLRHRSIFALPPN